MTGCLKVSKEITIRDIWLRINSNGSTLGDSAENLAGVRKEGYLHAPTYKSADANIVRREKQGLSGRNQDPRSWYIQTPRWLIEPYRAETIIITPACSSFSNNTIGASFPLRCQIETRHLPCLAIGLATIISNRLFIDLNRWPPFGYGNFAV